MTKVNLYNRGQLSVKEATIELDAQVKEYDGIYYYHYSEADLIKELIKYDINFSEPAVDSQDVLFFLQKIEAFLKSQAFTATPYRALTTEFFNFEILNVDKNHPDRTPRDTFMLPGLKPISMELINALELPRELTTLTELGQSPLSLPTHTTGINFENLATLETRTGKFYLLGTSFRRQREDKTHKIEFYSLQLFINDTIFTFEKLEQFFANFFKQCFNLEIYLRRTEYPYTNPSFEILCKKENKEIELAGGGFFYASLMKIFKIDSVNCIGASIGLERVISIVKNKKTIDDLYKL